MQFTPNERRVLLALHDLKNKFLPAMVGISMGWLRRKKWAAIVDGMVVPAGDVTPEGAQMKNCLRLEKNVLEEEPQKGGIKRPLRRSRTAKPSDADRLSTEGLFGASFDLSSMERGELCRDQHAVLVQTDRMRSVKPALVQPNQIEYKNALCKPLLKCGV